MIELKLFKSASQSSELLKTSLPGGPDLPLIENSTLAIACIALSLCVLLLVVYCWRLRKAGSPASRTFQSGDTIGDIAYSATLAQVGPVRPDAGSAAFHNSIHELTNTCTEVLKSLGGKSIALTATTGGTGVTTTAVALARDFANQGHRTLLLDMNIASPMVQQATRTFSLHGISNYLMSGLVDDIVVQDSSSPLDIIGIGNVPIRNFQTFLQGREFKDSFTALTRMYDLVIIDCPPASDADSGISRIAAECDLRLLLVDVQVGSEHSTRVQETLREHRRWGHGTTLVLRSKVSSDATDSAENDLIQTPSAGSAFRPIQAEAWIVRQPDELYTLKLTELNYRPILTRRQLSAYEGHQVACFRLTVLGKPNYLLILGQFKTRSEALSTASALGLTQPSIMPVTFATVKLGIKHELNRKLKQELRQIPALSE